MSSIVMDLQTFNSVDNNYNVNEIKFNSFENLEAQKELKKVANIKYNLAQRLNNYNLNEKESVYEKAMGGVYGGNINNFHIHNVHNNDFNTNKNVLDFKKLIETSQKDNSAFGRIIISQKHWEEFYDNYLHEKNGKVEINSWQIYVDLKSTCEQYHKLIYINKYNDFNKLVGDNKINLNTYNLENKINTVGYDSKNFNFYFSQHTNTDNPHFHIVFWDKTIKNKEGYMVYKNDLFELKKSFDHKLYRNTKWKELNKLVTRKNYLTFENDVKAKNNYSLFNLALSSNFTNFRYKYLKPEQKKLIDNEFKKQFENTQEYQKIISNLEKYYQKEAIIKTENKEKQKVYVQKKTEDFFKPYKQILLNDLKKYD